MPTVDVFDMNGKVVSKMELSETIFGIKPNKVVMHMAVVNYLANQRQGTQSTLTRSEVRGGGKKPWRQKGTGHARQGSIRAPQWRHGGVALGPKPRDYSYSINKKVKRLALKSALSSKIISSNFIVLDKLSFEEYKTKQMIEVLSKLGVDKKTLIVMSEPDNKIKKSAANIPGVTTTLVNTINVYDILNHEKLIIVKDAINKIEETYKQI
ncbi:MAG: 50S ribosomal protein L4 [Oscillospiraceae bacterium]|nr:50S ribosomal protein L4 [Oscillospiraceae bacterium]